jgi:hypothetical protein
MVDTTDNAFAQAAVFVVVAIDASSCRPWL